MKLKSIILFAAFSILFTNCAIVHKGSFISSALLDKGNFKIKGIATGSSSTIYIIGLGGITQSGLIAEAKKDLYKDAHLLDNQVLANISCDHNYSYIFGPIYIRHQVILTGDIVEFTDNTSAKSDTLVKTIKVIKEIRNYGVNVGNSVKYKDVWGFAYEGVVLKVEGDWFTIEKPNGKIVMVKASDLILKQ